MNKNFKNYYKILGLAPAASQAAVKQAYRQLAKRYHPDVTGQNDQMFKEIAEAYEVLGHVDKRAQYDRTMQLLGYISAANKHVVYDAQWLVQQFRMLEQMTQSLTREEVLDEVLTDYILFLLKTNCLTLTDQPRALTAINESLLSLVKKLPLSHALLVFDYLSAQHFLKSEPSWHQLIAKLRLELWWQKALPFIIILAALCIAVMMNFYK